MDRQVLASLESEYRRYKALAEASLAQLTDEQMSQLGSGGGNSVTIMGWHVAGNLASRFTDFLTADGEKPWRDREDEFATRAPTREEFTSHWDRGWGVLFDTLASLTDADLTRTVTIRQTPLTVPEALHRSLAHAAYHVGQMVYRARELKGEDWEFLSIAPGQSAAYNQDPTSERGSSHAQTLRRRNPK